MRCVVKHNMLKLVFCFWNHFLTADFTLSSVLLYSHQHTDHHKRLAFVCDSIGGTFPSVNPLNAELNPICHLLALLGAHHIFHASRIRVKNSITARCLNRTSEKLFHFDVHWVRTVSICGFKVKYDGREISCDYTEPVLSRCVHVNKILQWRQNLSAHIRISSLLNLLYPSFVLLTRIKIPSQ